MTPETRAAADHLRTFLNDVDDNCRKAGIDPADHRSARLFPGFPYDLTIGDLHALLAGVDTAATLAAAIDRTTAKMHEYQEHGSGTVNVRQVVNLLSPTWPDGNYEQPTDRNRPLTDEPCGLIPTQRGRQLLADYREQHPKEPTDA